MKATNTGLTSQGSKHLRFINVKSTSDTQFVLVNHSNTAFNLYLMCDGKATNLNLTLSDDFVKEVYVSNDTLVYISEQRNVLTRTVVTSKIGSRFCTLFDSTSSNVQATGLTIWNGKLYFRVKTLSFKWFESSFRDFDAKPSEADHHQRTFQKLQDGSIRAINFSSQSIERFQSTGGTSMLSSKPFPPHLFQRDPSDIIIKNLSANIFEINSTDYGKEICIVNQADSFVVLDLTPGMYSSFNVYDYTPNFIIPGTDTAFVIVKNLENRSRYIYRILADTNTTFEPIHHVVTDSIYHQLISFNTWKNNLYMLIEDSRLDELQLYEIPRNSGAISVPVFDFNLNSLEWHRQIGTGFLGDLSINFFAGGIDLIDSGDVIVSGFTPSQSVLVSNRYLLSYQNNKKHKAVSGQYTARYTSKGDLDWITSYGVRDAMTDINFHQVVDKNGDVYITGQAGNSAIFGADTVRVNDHVMNYLLKLNGKTGELLWYKVLFTSSGSDMENIDYLTVDANNCLYLAIKYSNRSIRILNKLLTNDFVSPANAVVKFNEHGELIWAVNTITPFTRNFGITRNMIVNQRFNQLLLVQSVGYYNWISTCKFTTWHTYVQSISLDNGSLIWSKLFESDDLHSTTTISLNKQSDILIAGYFRGTIQFDEYRLNSLATVDCHQFQPFYTVLNSSSGKVLFSNTSEHDLFYPFSARSMPGGNSWIVGAKQDEEKNYYLSIAEVNKFGVKIRDRNFRKMGNPFDYGFHPRIDVSKDFVAVADMVTSDLDTFKYCFPFGNQLSFLKFNVSSIPPISNQIVSRISITDYGIQLYPNPTQGEMTLITENANQIHAIYLLDLMGREVRDPMQLDPFLTYQNIDLKDIPKGIYLLKFVGSKGIQSIKVVKSK